MLALGLGRDRSVPAPSFVTAEQPFRAKKENGLASSARGGMFMVHNAVPLGKRGPGQAMGREGVTVPARPFVKSPSPRADSPVAGWIPWGAAPGRMPFLGGLRPGMKYADAFQANAGPAWGTVAHGVTNEAGGLP